MNFIKLLFNPSIPDPDKFREWKLNSFYRFITALFLILDVPAGIAFLVIGHLPMLCITLCLMATMIPFYIMLRHRMLALSVHSFVAVSFLFNLAFIGLLQVSDSVYFCFFDTFLAGVFLSFPAAIAWAMIITTGLILVAWFSPVFSVLPGMGLSSTGIPQIITHGTHLSTAILMIWGGALFSLLFSKYVTDLIGSLLQANEQLKAENRERQRAENQARAAQEFSDQIISDAGEGIVVCNKNYACLVWNHAMERMTGIVAKNAIGLPIFNHLPVLMEPDSLVLFEKVLAGETARIPVIPFSIPATNRQGYLAGLLSSYRGNNGAIDGIVAILRDVTDQKHLEESLRQSQKLEAVGQLAGGVAHDYNNQLTGILGYAEMIRRHAGDNLKITEWADNIQLAVRRSADLTSKLLAFARKGKYTSVAVDMHGIIREVIGILEHSIDRRIEIQQNLSAAPSTALGDPSMLQNALLNLAINARDAMPQGGILGFSTSLVTFEKEFYKGPTFTLPSGTYIKIAVSDTGLGMSQEIQQRIFEPFFTTKDPGKGTGMGLAAVYGTMKNHAGAVVVDSAPGKGSVFVLYLPSHVNEKQAESTSNEVPIRAKPRAHVLVADDDPLILNLTMDMLRMAGYKTTGCRDGAEAVDYYRRFHPAIDCIVLDFIMPKMNGSEVYAELRKINPAVRIVLASGYGFENELAQLIAQEGVAAFIKKPYDSTQLYDALDTALRIKGAA